MSSYKPAGLFMQARTFKRWILVCDGEESPFHRKSLALLALQPCRERCKEVRLYEETTIRYRTGTHWDHDDKIRTDITDRISRETETTR